jgi:hypothetical protein
MQKREIIASNEASKGGQRFIPLSIFHCQLSIDKKTPWMGDWNSSGVNNHKINTYNK